MLRTRLALSLLLLAPTAALAQQADLSGHWAVQVPANDKHRPGSALFVKTGAGRYDVKLILHVKQELVVVQLQGGFDGTTLVLGPAGVDAGIISAVGNQPPSSSNVKTARYELRIKNPGPLDLERLVLLSGSIEGVRMPRELHRTTGPMTPPHWQQASRVRAPAEWEQAEEILWGAKDEFAVSTIYAAAIKGTAHEAVDHWLYTSSQAGENQLRYELAEAGVDLSSSKVRFSNKRFQTVWMRDFGPIILERLDGVPDGEDRRIVGDMGYYSDRPADDFVPAQYARARRLPRFNVESLKLEGGNYMSDGAGRIFTTSRAFEQNQSQHGIQAHVEDRLRDLGAREVLFFERMPEPEGTGHIDMFAKLVDADTVLVGRCDSPPKFKAVLDRNAQRFEELGYEVIRLDMASGSKLMTYTNSLFVGKTVLVPTYNNPTRDAAALKIYRDLGWNAVGIDAREVIKANGAIHCISMQIPR